MRILLIAISALCLSACQQEYMQIVETKSTNTKLDNNNCYVYEDATVKMTYLFWHDQGTMSFSVYNKTDMPLYIDWSRSSLILNGSKMNYWVSNNDEEASLYYGKYYYKGPIMAPGYNLSAEVGVSSSNGANNIEKITFIPPKSNYYRTQFRLMSEEFIELDKTKYETVTSNEDEKKKTKVYSAQYDKNNTPLDIRNYIAISKSEKAENPTFVENEFYISGVQGMYIGHALGKDKKQTNSRGEKVFDLPYKKNNSFYILHYDVNKVEGMSNEKYITKSLK
jgi:hypothetical protein